MKKKKGKIWSIINSLYGLTNTQKKKMSTRTEDMFIGLRRPIFKFSYLFCGNDTYSY